MFLLRSQLKTNLLFKKYYFTQWIPYVYFLDFSGLINSEPYARKFHSFPNSFAFISLKTLNHIMEKFCNNLQTSLLTWKARPNTSRKMKCQRSKVCVFNVQLNVNGKFSCWLTTNEAKYAVRSLSSFLKNKTCFAFHCVFHTV